MYLLSAKSLDLEQRKEGVLFRVIQKDVQKQQQKKGLREESPVTMRESDPSLIQHS